MTEEEKEKRKELRIKYFDSVNVSEEELEKKITYISAGGLALSITFIEKIVNLEKAEYFWILILGWILLASTLSINLISTYTSRKLTMKSVDDLDTEPNEEDLIANVKRRNKIISNLDFSSLITLLIGISLVILFCSLNLRNKKITVMDDKDIIEKGKLIQTPSTGGNGSSGSGNSSGSSSGSSGSGSSNSGSSNSGS